MALLKKKLKFSDNLEAPCKEEVNVKTRRTPEPTATATKEVIASKDETECQVTKIADKWELESIIAGMSIGPEIGKYNNWSSQHGALASEAWCCIGDLMSFCDKYEFKSLSLTDAKTHSCICAEVRALLSGPAPFNLRKRFPGNIHNPENLWVCIGRCGGVEYHLNRILNVFRKPLEKLSTDRQREARQNFHLAINELRLDISARITDVKLYDRDVFEREFHLNWVDSTE